MRACFDGVLMPSISQLSSIEGAVPGYTLAAIEGAPSFEGVKLVCGSYANGEGLEVSYLKAPSRFPLKLHRIEPSNAAKGLLKLSGDEGVSGYFNPLSWKTLTPVEAEALGCIESEWGPLAPPGLDQLRVHEPSRCISSSPPSSRDKLSIGGLVESGATYSGVGGWRVYKLEGGWMGYGMGGSLVLFPGSRDLELKVKAAKLKVRILYLNSFSEPLGTCYFEKGFFEATALTISFGARNVALASREPFTLELERGVIRITSKTPLKLLPGGSEAAFRALAESLIEWKVVEGPQNPPNFYSVLAHALIVDAGGNIISIKAFTLEGFEGGRVHFNPPGPVDSVEVLGPGGEFTVMPGGPRISIPLPPCFCGYIKVRLRPQAKFRLKARLRRG